MVLPGNILRSPVDHRPYTPLTAPPVEERRRAALDPSWPLCWIRTEPRRLICRRQPGGAQSDSIYIYIYIRVAVNPYNRVGCGEQNSPAVCRRAVCGCKQLHLESLRLEQRLSRAARAGGRSLVPRKTRTTTDRSEKVRSVCSVGPKGSGERRYIQPGRYCPYRDPAVPNLRRYDWTLLAPT